MKVTFLATTGAFAAAMIFAMPSLEAKPGKGNGGGGGKPAHAEKGGKGSKGKPDKGGKVIEKAKKGHGKALEKAAKVSREELERWRFADRDRNQVHGYFEKYRGNEHGLPPGLAKNLRRGKGLPPGWQKKLNTGYALDDIWWREFTPVSYDYFPQMERYPNTGLYLYDDRVIRVYEPRREVIDVMIVPTIRLR